MGANADGKTGLESGTKIDDERVFVENSMGEASNPRSPGQPRGSRHQRTFSAPHRLGKRARTLLAVAVTAATVMLGVTAVSAANADTSSTVPTPVIVSPTDGSSTNQMSPAVNGTGVSGDTISVYDGNTLLASDIGILANGYWQMPNNPLLAPGSHTLTAVQTDPSGDTSPASSLVTVSIVPTPGVAAPVITTPTNDSVTNNTNLQVSGTIVDSSGTVVDGNRVTVWDGSTVLATFLGAGGGTWWTSLPTNFPLGTHVLTAAQVDSNGDISAASAPVTFTVVASAIYPAPVIISPAGGATTNNATPQINGTAVAGDGNVTLYDGATEVASNIEVDSDGSWHGTPSTPLAEGTHTFTAVQIDGLGNTSAVSAPVTFTVTAAPDIAAPAITSPADGATTSDVNTVIRGTGTPGDSVTLSDGSTVIASDLGVQGDGTWWVSSLLYFAPGTHTLTAIQVDSSGDTSAVSAPVTFTIPADATIAAPVITSPTDGATTSDVNTGVRGTGIPGDLVTLFDGSTVIASDLGVQGDGSWWVSSTLLFLPGTHTLTAVQADSSGHTSATSAAVTLTTTSTVGIAAPVITTPTDGWVTNNTSIGVSGTGTPGDYVVVSEGSTVFWPSLQVQDNGDWWTSSSVTLPVGTHTLTAVQVDPSGNMGVASAQVTITISDTPVVAAPVITSPTDGTVTNNTKPVISGTGVANGTVTVSVDNGAQTFTQSIDGDGNWSSGLNVPLSVGTHTLTATDSNGLGNTSAASAPVTITVTSDPIGVAPVITTPVDGSTTNSTSPYISGTGTPGDNVTVSDSGTVIASAAVLSDGQWWNSATLNLADGLHTLTAFQTDPQGNTSPVSASVTVTITALPLLAAPTITTPTDGTTTNNTNPPVNGTGIPGDNVTVSDNGSVIFSAKVGSDGTWANQDTLNFADGTNTLTAVQSDSLGNVSPTSVPVTITVTSVPVLAAPVISSPVDGTTTNNTTPRISGTGVPGDWVALSDGSTVLNSTIQVQADSSWWFTPATPLSDGVHVFTATQSNTSEQVSGVSNSVSVTVTSTPVLAAPVITAPVSGSTVTTGTPTLSGTGIAGDTVSVLDGSTVLTSSVVVASDGSWSYTPATALTVGAHSLTATQSDADGNVSAVSSPVTVTVTAPAPVAPVITAPSNGSTVTTATPTLSGTGVPGAVVTVSDAAGALVPTATVGTNGTWSLTPSVALVNGSYTFTATQSNANGSSAVSAAVNVTVSVPSAPPSGGSSGSSLSDVLTAIVNVVTTIVKTILSVMVSIRNLFNW